MQVLSQLRFSASYMINTPFLKEGQPTRIAELDKANAHVLMINPSEEQEPAPASYPEEVKAIKRHLWRVLTGRDAVRVARDIGLKVNSKMTKEQFEDSCQKTLEAMGPDQKTQFWGKLKDAVWWTILYQKTIGKLTEERV